MDFATLLSLLLVFAALVRGSRLKARVLVLEAKVAQLLAPSARTASMRDAVMPLRQAAAPETEVATGAPETVAFMGDEPADARMSPDTEAAPLEQKVPRRGIESTIGNRWGLWLGGFVLLLSAGFFVREAVINGWVGPVSRTVSLFALGFGFTWAGRANMLDRFAGKLEAGGSQLRPVLTAAGVSFLYAGAYAAGPHYNLIGSAPFSAFMVAISIFALYSSVSYGIPVAVIGVFGGFFLPFIAGYSTSNLGTTGTLCYLAILFVTADVGARRSNRLWLQGLAAAAVVIDGADVSSVDPHGAILFLALTLYLTAAATLTKDSHRKPATYAAISALAAPLVLGTILAAGSLDWLVCFGLLTPFLLAVARLRPALWNLAALAGLADLVFLSGWHAGELHDASLSIAAVAIALGFTIPLIKPGAKNKTDSWVVLQAVMSLGAATILYGRTARLPLYPGHELSGWTILFAAMAILYFAASLDFANRMFPGRTAFGQLVQRIVAFVSGLAAIAYLAPTHEVANTMIAFTVVVLSNAGETGGFYRYLRPAIFLLTLLCCMGDLSRMAGDLFIQRFSLVLTSAFIPAILLRLLCAVLRGRQLAARSGQFEDADVFNLAAGGFVLAGLFWAVAWANSHGLFGADDAFWVPTTFMAVILSASACLWAAWRFLPQAEKPSRSASILRWVYAGLAGGMMLCLLAVNPFTLDQRIAEWPLPLLAAEYGIPILSVLFAIRNGVGHLPDRLQAIGRKAGFGFVEIAGFVLLSTITYVISNGQADPLTFITREIWSLSAVWMVYGGMLIFIGLAGRENALRYGGMIVIGITALKVLFVDTTNLDGMARVATLFFLGIMLIAIGMLYQKYARIIEAD